jgi:hypothetical protein
MTHRFLALAMVIVPTFAFAASSSGSGKASGAAQGWVEPEFLKTSAEEPATDVGKTASQCDAEYAANEAAIKASGETKSAFVAGCLRQ